MHRMSDINPHNITIRMAVPSDAGEISRMAAELLEEIMHAIGQPVFHVDLPQLNQRCADYLERGIYTVFLAVSAQDEPVGFIALHESHALYAEGAFGTIPELYVRPAYRSCQAGECLMNAAKGYGRNKGWKRLEVTTPPLPAFDRTLHFYQAHGFDVAGGRKMKVLL
jgi:GNAT superfamily N-acetyltransferase